MLKLLPTSTLVLVRFCGISVVIGINSNPMISMINFSAQQLSSLSDQRYQRFIERINRFLGQKLGSPWEAIDLGLRSERLQTYCSQGVSLGIRREIDLAEFTLLLMFAGEGFLSREEVQAIVNHTEMSWGEKLFQMMPIAGIDLSALPPQRV
jgi:hypothetical protein